MSTEITEPGDPIKEFQENIQAKLRDQIGTLMPEAMLKKIVEDSVQSILYRPVTKSSQSNNYYGVKETQPWITETVEKEIGNHVKVAVNNTIEEQKDKLQNIIEDYLAQNMKEIISTLIINLLSANSYTWGMNIAAAINNRR